MVEYRRSPGFVEYEIFETNSSKPNRILFDFVAIHTNIRTNKKNLMQPNFNYKIKNNYCQKGEKYDIAHPHLLFGLKPVVKIKTCHNILYFLEPNLPKIQRYFSLDPASNSYSLYKSYNIWSYKNQDYY